jgi:hypothetical protein
MAEAQPAPASEQSPYLTAKDCLWMMAIGLPFIVGGLLGCWALGKFEPWILLMTVGYGLDMPVAWGWILIRVLRGEKLINPITLPIDNRLCDVELTVDKIRFGVQLVLQIALFGVGFTSGIKPSDLPFLYTCCAGIFVMTLLRTLQLRRQLRAWRAVGGTVGTQKRQRQVYGGGSFEEGQ